MTQINVNDEVNLSKEQYNLIKINNTFQTKRINVKLQLYNISRRLNELDSLLEYTTKKIEKKRLDISVPNMVGCVRIIKEQEKYFVHTFSL